MASVVITTKSKNDLELIISLAERLQCSVLHLPEAANRLIESKNLIDSVTRIIRQSESLKFFNGEDTTEKSKPAQVSGAKRKRKTKAAGKAGNKS